MKKTYDGPMMQTTIHTLNTGITRLYLLKGSLGYILVDTGLHMSKERFEELFLECGVKASEISLIIVTHAHPDHYSGMKAIRELTEAPILAHKKALHTLVTGEIIDVHPRNECGRRFKSLEISSHLTTPIVRKYLLMLNSIYLALGLQAV